MGFKNLGGKFKPASLDDLDVLVNNEGIEALIAEKNAHLTKERE
jgi:hypothetical protein